ncbi:MULTISPECIES: hypothetical protein [unclassified Frankia]|uniref:hypothetical protein n=1 Tax=unclassified Frankia TaxID=2632575 RepID=UPI0020242D61
MAAAGPQAAAVPEADDPDDDELVDADELLEADEPVEADELDALDEPSAEPLAAAPAPTVSLLDVPTPASLPVLSFALSRAPPPLPDRLSVL